MAMNFIFFCLKWNFTVQFKNLTHKAVMNDTQMSLVTIYTLDMLKTQARGKKSCLIL